MEKQTEYGEVRPAKMMDMHPDEAAPQMPDKKWFIIIASCLLGVVLFAWFGSIAGGQLRVDGAMRNAELQAQAADLSERAAEVVEEHQRDAHSEQLDRVLDAYEAYEAFLAEVESENWLNAWTGEEYQHNLDVKPVENAAAQCLQWVHNSWWDESEECAPPEHMESALTAFGLDTTQTMDLNQQHEAWQTLDLGALGVDPMDLQSTINRTQSLLDQMTITMTRVPALADEGTTELAEKLHVQLIQMQMLMDALTWTSTYQDAHQLAEQQLQDQITQMTEEQAKKDEAEAQEHQRELDAYKKQVTDLENENQRLQNELNQLQTDIQNR